MYSVVSEGCCVITQISDYNGALNPLTRSPGLGVTTWTGTPRPRWPTLRPQFGVFSVAVTCCYCVVPSGPPGLALHANGERERRGWWVVPLVPVYRPFPVCIKCCGHRVTVPVRGVTESNGILPHLSSRLSYYY